jgi:glycine cleavage system T protein (aminomethyltransferase)
MGEVEVKGHDALEFLQYIATQDVATIHEGQSNYALLCRPDGGIVDDIFIYHLPDGYMVVVNASNIEKDFAWMLDNLHGFDVELTNISDRASMLALQGPLAEAILAKATDIDAAGLPFHGVTTGMLLGDIPALIARTGYTGEDGFEVFCAPQMAPRVWNALLEAGQGDGLVPCGLGARDTLRLEASMRLYGNDIDDTTTPLQADLGWIVGWKKTEFIGHDVVRKEKAEGVPRVIVGFAMVDRAIARHGHVVMRGDDQVGVVTSGTQTPFLKKAIGMAYVPPSMAALGTEFDIDIRGRRAKAIVVQMPFYKRPKA